MEIVSGENVVRPVCAATELARYVDDTLNGAARQEADEATSKLQPLGLDMGEGNAYLESAMPEALEALRAAETKTSGEEAEAPLGEAEENTDDDEALAEGDFPLEGIFKRQDRDCTLCHGLARLSPDGSVSAFHCQVSGSCELGWATKYPESYRQDDGTMDTSRTICEAEIGCSAVIAFAMEEDGQTAKPKILRGQCRVILQGIGWQDRYHSSIGRAPLEAPGEDPSEFDGERFEGDGIVDIADDATTEAEEPVPADELGEERAS